MSGRMREVSRATGSGIWFVLHTVLAKTPKPEEYRMELAAGRAVDQAAASEAGSAQPSAAAAMSEGLGNVTISGVYWASQPRGWLDIIRCAVGLHRAAMTGTLRDGEFVERCTCGAIRMGRFWLAREYWLHRVSREESARLIAEDEERERSWRQTMAQWNEMRRGQR